MPVLVRICLVFFGSDTNTRRLCCVGYVVQSDSTIDEDGAAANQMGRFPPER